MSWYKDNKLELFDMGKRAGVIVILLGCAITYSYLMDIKEVPTVDQITPLHNVQEVRKCYSPFDIYLTDSYDIVEDNKTLITSHC